MGERSDVCIRSDPDSRWTEQGPTYVWPRDCRSTLGIGYVQREPFP